MLSAIKFLHFMVFSVLALLVSTAPLYAETVNLSISATTKLSTTGIELGEGDTALITATGLISYGSGGPSVCRSSIPPSGCSAETICPGPGGCGSLIGQLDDGALFLVGDQTTVSGPGALNLGINDFDTAFGDNSGSFSVSVNVSRKGRSISGTVTGVVCNSDADPATACQTEAVSNVLVAVRQGATLISRKRTTSDGQYSFKIKKKGDYVVTASMADTVGVPRQRRVKVKDSAVTNVDFDFPVPNRITVYMQNKAYRAERKAVRSGGTIVFCGRNVFPYSPYALVEGQSGAFFELSFNVKSARSCKSVNVVAPNGTTTRLELRDALHINMLSYVFVVPD